MSTLPLHVPLFLPADIAGPAPRLLRALALGLALGLLVQGGMLLVLAWQDAVPQLPRLMADTLRLGVLGGTTGLVIGSAVVPSKGRWDIAAGLTLVGAALAFLLARGVQIAALGALTGADIHGATPWVPAAIYGSVVAVVLVVLARLGRSRA